MIEDGWRDYKHKLKLTDYCPKCSEATAEHEHENKTVTKALCAVTNTDPLAVRTVHSEGGHTIHEEA